MKLWLTYAWLDNERSDVDFVAQELRSAGIDVLIDRFHLRAGRRLWDQISEGILDPDKSDAWAIYVTQNALESEACREELAIALIRAVRRGSNYPIVGIFPDHLPDDLIPAALKLRLYVTLGDADWITRIVGAIDTERHGPLPTQIQPYDLTIWPNADLKERFPEVASDLFIVEIRPRLGRWTPTAFVVPLRDKFLLRSMMVGPRNYIPSVFIGSRSGVNEPEFAGEIFYQPVADTNTSLFVTLGGIPSLMLFGTDTPEYSLTGEDLKRQLGRSRPRGYHGWTGP